jgi:hypothetical protein
VGPTVGDNLGSGNGQGQQCVARPPSTSGANGRGPASTGSAETGGWPLPDASDGPASVEAAAGLQGAKAKLNASKAKLNASKAKLHASKAKLHASKAGGARYADAAGDAERPLSHAQPPICIYPICIYQTELKIGGPGTIARPMPGTAPVAGRTAPGHHESHAASTARGARYRPEGERAEAGAGADHVAPTRLRPPYGAGRRRHRRSGPA